MCMVVERAFGILKGKWHILLKRIDVPLRFTCDLVIACICLHNLCLVHRGEFDMEWAKKAMKDVETLSNLAF